MKIAVVGAGAMGGSFGGLLSDSGHDVSLIDIWEEHVAAIERDGLLVDEALGEHRVHLPAATEPADGQTADLVIVFTDANNTADGAKTAARLLGNDGYAVTFQNGIGNVEALQAELGADRVVGGSSMCSAATRGPGHVSLTHLRTTSVGPIGNGPDAPVDAIVEALNGAGLTAQRVDDAMPIIWEKFIVNCGVNALAATTGLRTGEMVRRVPEMIDFQANVLDEVMAVVDAKGIALPNPDIAKSMPRKSRNSFNQPSMLQHVLAGRKTEIDSINGALVREAKELGVPVPYNESLVALLKGREYARIQAVHGPDIDYDAWQARIDAGEED
jgi:2-dehydropantoate 2-reductase